MIPLCQSDGGYTVTDDKTNPDGLNGSFKPQWKISRLKKALLKPLLWMFAD